jgi:hypothetical protein
MMLFGLVRDRLLLTRSHRVRLLQVVALDLGARLLAEGRALELDVVLCETARELHAVRRVRRRRLEEILQTLNFRDEQALRARRQTTLSLVARLRLGRRVRSFLLLALLEIRRRRRRVEVHLGRLAVRADVECRGAFVLARRQRRLRGVRDADAALRVRSARRQERDAGRDEDRTENTPNHLTSHTSR